MDKVLAVLCMIAVIAFIAIGEIYLKMDKHRSLALVFLKKMAGGLQDWLSVVENLFSLSYVSSLQIEEFNRLSDAYHKIQKKHFAKKVPVLNQIHALAVSVIAENVENPEINALGHELSNVFWDFYDLQAEYNANVAKLNSLLNRKISGAVGKFMHLYAFEKLNELSVL